MKASACQNSLPVAERHQGGDGSQDRPSESDAGLRGGVVTHRLGGDHRAHEGDEHRGRRLDSLAPELEDVAELVEEEQEHEADREEPAEDQLVGDD